MRSAVGAMRRVSACPWFTLIIGLALFGSGLAEAWDGLSNNLLTLNIGSEHGVILLGVAHILRALPELFEGLEYAEEVLEQHQATASAPPAAAELRSLTTVPVPGGD